MASRGQHTTVGIELQLGREDRWAAAVDKGTAFLSAVIAGRRGCAGRRSLRKGGKPLYLASWKNDAEGVAGTAVDAA